MTEDETIRDVAASGAAGYVATPHGPMNVAVCQVLAALEEAPAPLELFRSEWFQVGKQGDTYIFGALLENGDTAPWRTRDGADDVACALNDLRELHELLGRIIRGEAGQVYEPSRENGEQA